MEALVGAGRDIWNFFMTLVTDGLLANPKTFAGGGVWSEIIPISDLMVAIGEVLLNFFFLISFLKSIANFKQQLTLEVVIEQFIKLLVCNAVLHMTLTLASTIFRMNTTIVGYIQFSATGFTGDAQMDFPYTGFIDVLLHLGEVLLIILVGLLHILVAFACGLIIMITVWTRLLQVFLLTAVAPLPLSVIVGGGNTSQIGYTFSKYFIGKACQPILIALSIKIGQIICTHLTDFFLNSKFTGTSDGIQTVLAICIEILCMIVITSAVKGTDNLTQRAFGM